MSEELNTGRQRASESHPPRVPRSAPPDGHDRPSATPTQIGVLSAHRVPSPVEPWSSGRRALAESRSASAGPSPAAGAPSLRPARASTLPPSIPCGGSQLPQGDQPGDPYATLIVIAGDGLIGIAPARWAPGGVARCALAPSIMRGIEAAVALTAVMPR